MKKLIITVVLIFITITSVKSQNSIQNNNISSIKDSIENEKSMIGFGLGLCLPISDMKKKYGFMFSGNLSYHYKISKTFYTGLNIFFSPAFFPKVTRDVETSAFTFITAEIRYNFYTDKRKSTIYTNFGLGAYITQDYVNEGYLMPPSIKTNFNPGANVGIGLIGHVSESVIFDLNTTYNIYYHSGEQKKIYNFVLPSLTFKFFL